MFASRRKPLKWRVAAVVNHVLSPTAYLFSFSTRHQDVESGGVRIFPLRPLCLGVRPQHHKYLKGALDTRCSGPDQFIRYEKTPGTDRSNGRDAAEGVSLNSYRWKVLVRIVAI